MTDVSAADVGATRDQIRFRIIAANDTAEGADADQVQFWRILARMHASHLARLDQHATCYCGQHCRSCLKPAPCPEQIEIIEIYAEAT